MRHLLPFLFLCSCFAPAAKHNDKAPSDGGSRTTNGDAGPNLQPNPVDGGGADQGPVNTNCDPVAQSGCGTGQECTVLDNAITCAPAGNKPEAAPCAANTSQCAPGATCIDVSSTTPLCRTICKTDSECKASFGQEKSRCVTLSDFPVNLCSVPCNPIPEAGPSGCPASLSCVYTTLPSIGALTDCIKLGLGQDGSSCPNGVTDCAEGYTCNASVHRCRKLCRPDFVTDCDGQCLSQMGAAYGICIPAT